MNLDEYRRLKPPVDKMAQAQADLRRGVASQAQQVVDHPAWQLFLNHLQAVLDNLSSRRDAIQAQIVTGNEVGEMLIVLKMQLREVVAEQRGVTMAMELIPELIKRGGLETT